MSVLGLPYGAKVLSKDLLDTKRGPYVAADEATAKALANAAVTSGIRGQGQQVDLIIAGVTAVYVWKAGTADADLVPATASVSSTDAVPEGANNFYFTVARVLATIVGAMTFNLSGVVQSTDTIYTAIVRLQSQILALLSTNLTGNDDTHAPTVKAVNTALALKANAADAFVLTPTQIAGLTAGVDYIPSVQKQVDGSVVINTTTSSIDLFMPPTANATLVDPAGWGNVPGQNGEYKKITGIDNRTGAFGRASQQIVLNGTLYVCIDHDLGTTNTNGSATYVRNRSINFLSAEYPNYANISAALVVDGNFDAMTNLAVLTYKCTPGTLYQASTGGYTYLCLSDYLWSRSGLTPPYQPMAITSGSHPNLVSHLLANAYSTSGPYVQGSVTTGGVDEASYQGQIYWSDHYFIIKGLGGKWNIIPTNTINLP